MPAYRKTPIATLETKRLWLQPLREEDAPRIQELFPNPNVVRYLNASIPWPYPEDGAMSHVRSILPKIEAQEEYCWSIFLKGREDEGMVGLIALTPASDEDNRGFWLGEPYWGQGLMREAATAVTDFAFDVLGMEALLLNNGEPNAASHRLKASAGAEVIEVREEGFIGGTFPSVRWRLIAEAWRRSQGRKTS